MGLIIYHSPFANGFHLYGECHRHHLYGILGNPMNPIQGDDDTTVVVGVWSAKKMGFTRKNCHLQALILEREREREIEKTDAG